MLLPSLADARQCAAMKRYDFMALCLAASVLSGCATVGSVLGRDDPVDPTDPCGAQGYSSLLGSSLAAVTLPADLNDRVVRPGDAVTFDYDPTRLNIELNDDGLIVGLSCG